jgi:FkbM family methyltransferase
LINGRWPIRLPDHRADWHEERPWWEANRLADMYAHRNRIRSIIDVGSEEGDFTALHATWGWDVAWIDPSRPWLIQTLETIRANECLLGPSFLGFAASVDKLDGKIVEEPRFASLMEEDEIARITLDTFVSLTDFRPDALTIDVEGSELSVLHGAKQLLGERVYIWLSVHDCDPHAPVPSACHEFLRGFGYQDQWLGSLHEHWYRFW